MAYARVMRVRICAPSGPFTREDALRVVALAARFPGLELDFHAQCFESQGHFAGPDAVRLAALVECASDPAADAVWFARGGYGAARIVEAALGQISGSKPMLGYSDAGTLLGAFYRAGIGRPVHAPMPADIRRAGGEAAVLRTMAWLMGDRSGEEPSADRHPRAAFNLMTLAMLIGTPLMPDLAGHVVLLEEVSEYHYAIDRLLFHVTAALAPMGIAGIRLGRCSDIPENDRPFGITPEAMAREWCQRQGIAFLGSADIGHDSANRIVPFGLAERPADQ